MSAPTMTRPVLALPGDVDRETWLMRRRSGLGSSDVAAALGISKWDGALIVYASKVYGSEKDVTDAMDLGTFLEPWVVAKFAKQHPELVVTPKPGTFVGEKPWHIATPDALAVDVDGAITMVEAKTASRWGDDAEEGWGEPGTDEIPYGYYVQVFWQCRIMGASKWVVPVLFDGREYREYCGEYVPALGDQIAARADKYWLDHIVARVEPQADAFESTRVLLNQRHTARPKSEGQLPYEAAGWAAEYLDLRDQKGDIDNEMKLRANLLRQALVAADCEVGKVETKILCTLTTTKTGSKRLDVKETAR
jgi:putative phage-type endonuclease